MKLTSLSKTTLPSSLFISYSSLILEMENQLCNSDECIDKTICTDDPIPQCVEYEERVECL